MPNNIRFKTGDRVQNENIGEGLVLSCKIDPVKCIPVYHIYLTDKKLFRYSYTRSLRLIAQADDTTIEQAQNILLNIGKQTRQIGRFEFDFGDTVRTPFGNMLLLDNGLHKPNGNQYYHALWLKNNTLCYINRIDIFGLKEKYTNASQKRAKQIILTEVIAPAFSDGKD